MMNARNAEVVCTSDSMIVLRKPSTLSKLQVWTMAENDGED